MITIQYYWLHAPTGKTGTAVYKHPGEDLGPSLSDAYCSLYRLIDSWNSKQPGIWVYSTYDLERPAPHTIAPSEQEGT